MKYFVSLTFMIFLFGSLHAQNPLVRELGYDNAGNRILRKLGTFLVDETNNLRLDDTALPTAISNVYPNPTSDLVTVELASPVPDAAIVVVDAAGRTVFSGKLADEWRTQIDVSNFPNGQYWILISGQSFQAKWALTKQD